MKKTKKDKAIAAYRRAFCRVCETGDLRRFRHDIDLAKKLHGQATSGQLFMLELHVYHTVILPEWLRNTNIEYRNRLLTTVRECFGNGLANELQLTSPKRTWR